LISAALEKKKQKPHPTVARGVGRGIDLVPHARQETRREVAPRG
jgi:hypothetical protein